MVPVPVPVSALFPVYFILKSFVFSALIGY